MSALDVLYDDRNPTEIFDTEKKRVSKPRKETNMKANVKTTIVSMLIGSVTTITAGWVVNQMFSNDPLREQYVKHPEVYGGDVVAVYDAYTRYCHPSGLAQMVVGYDAATCHDKDSALTDYKSKVMFRLANGEAVKNFRSDSSDALIATVEVNSDGKLLMDQRREALEKVADAEATTPVKSTLPGNPKPQIASVDDVSGAPVPGN